MTKSDNSKQYFLSFVEEGVQNPRFEGYITGRCEVYDNHDPSSYAVNEIRFLTRLQAEFDRFRETWDFKDIDETELQFVEEEMQKRFQDYSLCRT